jgi:hypothetical protein
MSEIKKLLVLAGAFAAFLVAAYIVGGGTWRGPHNLRKSLPAKGSAIRPQDAYSLASGSKFFADSQT